MLESIVRRSSQVGKISYEIGHVPGPRNSYESRKSNGQSVPKGGSNPHGTKYRGILSLISAIPAHS